MVIGLNINDIHDKSTDELLSFLVSSYNNNDTSYNGPDLTSVMYDDDNGDKRNIM